MINKLLIVLLVAATICAYCNDGNLYSDSVTEDCPFPAEKMYFTELSAAGETKNAALWCLNLDGFEKTELTSNDWSDFIVTADDHGKLYTAAAKEEGYAVFSMNNDGTDRTKLMSLPEFFLFSDICVTSTNQLVIAGENENMEPLFYLYDLETGNINKKMIPAEYEMGMGPFSVAANPVKKTVVITACAYEYEDDVEGIKGMVHGYDLVSGSVAPFITKTEIIRLSYSNNGSKLVGFESCFDDFLGYTGRIFTMDADGSNKVNLFTGHFMGPVFDSTNTCIIFASLDKGTAKFQSADLDGSNVETLLESDGKFISSLCVKSFR